jgi:hypothetical protein
MRPLRKIILHASGHSDDNAHEIDRRHRARGLKRIGFHYVICEDGRLERGRRIQDAGAHCLGFNADSVGVCLSGKGDVTTPQYLKLLRLLRKLDMRFRPIELVRVGEVDRWVEDPLSINMTNLRKAAISS